MVAGWGVTGLVFPACAGMFLQASLHQIEKARFPRVRGDVPYLGDDLAKGVVVFPACAGMFLGVSWGIRVVVWFSPRARGCSAD